MPVPVTYGGRSPSLRQNKVFEAFVNPRPPSSINPTGGFHFRRRRDRINWRILGSIDVHRLQQEVREGTNPRRVANLG
jgi:hypothetical protein